MVEEVSRRQKAAGEGLPGAVGHKSSSSPRSSNSPKQSSRSPSSGSDHSSSRSPPTYPQPTRSPPTYPQPTRSPPTYPPPPTSVPPPLPATQQTRGHAHQHNHAKRPQGDRKQQQQQYEVMMAQYHQDPAYNGRGMPPKPHPQYPPTHHPTYQNQLPPDARSQSHSTKQSGSGSGSRFAHSAAAATAAAPTEVVVNSKVIPSKQYATSLSNHSTLEAGPPTQQQPQQQQQVVEPLPPKPAAADHLNLGGGDPGVRESPSGASSPSDTPNNTLVRSSKVAYHYDPLTSSASDNKLSTDRKSVV